MCLLRDTADQSSSLFQLMGSAAQARALFIRQDETPSLDNGYCYEPLAPFKLEVPVCSIRQRNDYRPTIRSHHRVLILHHRCVEIAVECPVVIAFGGPVAAFGQEGLDGQTSPLLIWRLSPRVDQMAIPWDIREASGRRHGWRGCRSAISPG